MVHTEWRFQTEDGLTLFAQGWTPEVTPRGVVCLVHGLGEHSDRYAQLAEFLIGVGYAVLTFDLRGHGRSQGSRGHAASIEALMDDIARLLETAARRFPGQKTFLYGHSLGGLLVLNYILRRRPHLAGVIVTGPALRTALQQQKVKVAFVQLMGRLLPALSLPTGLDVTAISRDAQVVDAYRTDPLVHGRGTLAWGREILGAVDYAFQHACDFDQPLLLMHGSADRIVFPEGSREFARLVPCECTLKLWNGLYHEIHNEPEREQVFDYLAGWLDQKT